MVQLSLVPDDRRQRARDKKRQGFLEAAGRVLDQHGLAGLTMQAVADEVDCAVGTIYGYFSSKAELLAALEREAVEVLVHSYGAARGAWDAALLEEALDPSLAALVHLHAFGGFVCAASVVFGDEFALQRSLLTERPSGSSPDDLRRAMPVLIRWFETPRQLLDDAVEAGAIEPGDSLDRVVRWMSALNGVLLLERISPVDRYLFRAPHHGRRLTGDLLVGWGAERSAVEVAESHVDRLAALGPLAPPPH
jgi:AcrR family transcriptional regulator